LLVICWSGNESSLLLAGLMLCALAFAISMDSVYRREYWHSFFSDYWLLQDWANRLRKRCAWMSRMML